MRTLWGLLFLLLTISLHAQSTDCFGFEIALKNKNGKVQTRQFNHYETFAACEQRFNILSAACANQVNEDAIWRIDQIKKCTSCSKRNSSNSGFVQEHLSTKLSKNTNNKPKEFIRTPVPAMNPAYSLNHSKKDKPISWVGYLRNAERLEEEKSRLSPQWQYEALMNYYAVFKRNAYHIPTRRKLADYFAFFGYYEMANKHFQWLQQNDLEYTEKIRQRHVACQFFVDFDMGEKENDYFRLEGMTLNYPFLKDKEESLFLEKIAVSILVDSGWVKEEGLTEEGRKVEEAISMINDLKNTNSASHPAQVMDLRIEILRALVHLIKVSPKTKSTSLLLSSVEQQLRPLLALEYLK